MPLRQDAGETPDGEIRFPKGGRRGQGGGEVGRGRDGDSMEQEHGSGF